MPIIEKILSQTELILVQIKKFSKHEKKHTTFNLGEIQKLET